MHDVVDHGHEADVLIVLQAHQVGALRLVTAIVDREATGWQEARGLQLLATQADHHDLAAKIRVQADVAQRADRDLGAWRVNRHTTAVTVLQTHHAVHIRVKRQQLAFNAFHRNLDHTRHALHRGRDGQQVARADRAIGIHIAFKGMALERCPGRCWLGGHGQTLQLACSRNVEQALMHPAACCNGFTGVTHGHVVAEHGLTRSDVDQGHLVSLRDFVTQHQTGRRTFGHDRASRQAAIVGNDGHVVIRVHADGQRANGCVHVNQRAQKRGCLPVKLGSYLRICPKSSRLRMPQCT